MKIEKKFIASKAAMLCKDGRAVKKPRIENKSTSYDTYLEEVELENRAGMRLDKDMTSKPTAWGKFMEQYAYVEAPIGYKRVDNERLESENLNLVGYADLWDESRKRVAEVKSPFSRKVFMSLVLKLSKAKDAKERAEVLKKENADWYWQLMSYATMKEAREAALILFMPMEAQIEVIQRAVTLYDGADQSNYAFINYALKDELPYVKEGSQFKSFYEFEIEIGQEDKEHLIGRMTSAKIDLIEQLNYVL